VLVLEGEAGAEGGFYLVARLEMQETECFLTLPSHIRASWHSVNTRVEHGGPCFCLEAIFLKLTQTLRMLVDAGAEAPYADSDEEGSEEEREDPAVQRLVEEGQDGVQLPPRWLDVTAACQFMVENGRLVFHEVCRRLSRNPFSLERLLMGVCA
jgi:hypothetical protein